MQKLTVSPILYSRKSVLTGKNAEGAKLHELHELHYVQGQASEDVQDTSCPHA